MLPIINDKIQNLKKHSFYQKIEFVNSIYDNFSLDAKMEFLKEQVKFMLEGGYQKKYIKLKYTKQWLIKQYILRNL